MSKKLTKKDLEKYVVHKYGSGILDDAWHYVKKGASTAHKYVKDNKLISKGLKTYGAANRNSTMGALANIASVGADWLGYGRQKYSPKLKPVYGRGKTKLQQGLLP